MLKQYSKSIMIKKMLAGAYVLFGRNEGIVTDNSPSFFRWAVFINGAKCNNTF